MKPLKTASSSTETPPARNVGSIPITRSPSQNATPAGKPGKITHPMAASWIADTQLSMKHQGSGQWTDEQLFASYALARLKGGYHHLGKIKPNGRTGVETNVYGSMSTYDFKDLTDAVLIAHEMGVRIDIKSSGPRMLKVYAHTRVSSDDSSAFFVSDRHPTINGLIARAHAYNPEVALVFELVDATSEEQYFPLGVFFDAASAVLKAQDHFPQRWDGDHVGQAVSEVRVRNIGLYGGSYIVLWRGEWHYDYDAGGEWKLVEQQLGTLEKPLPITRA